MGEGPVTEVAHSTKMGRLTNVITFLYMALITFCGSSSSMKI